MSEYKEALYRIIGERIKSTRESLDLSQLELSKKLELSRSSISNIEVGRHQIPLHTLYEISKAFQVDINELLPNGYEIKIHATSEVNDYDRSLNSANLKEEQKEKIKNYLKNV